MTTRAKVIVTQRCPNYNRHWFTRYGMPTFRLPRCVRCGAPNPKWMKERPEMVLSQGEETVEAIERGW